MNADEPSPLSPIAVRPRYEDLPPFAYGITEENLPEVGAHLGLNAIVRNGHTILEIPFEYQFGLASTAEAGDWIIRHPVNIRHLEVVSGENIWKVYEQRSVVADLDESIRAEVPTATAWIVITDTPAGVGVFPGPGIASLAHAIGLAHTVAIRFSRGG